MIIDHCCWSFFVVGNWQGTEYHIFQLLMSFTRNARFCNHNEYKETANCLKFYKVTVSNWFFES